ncbi:ribosomal biogenesis factor [Excalfactoria chinensis]|uniref:ribosomal biogenesis factor n=1 Tax=Excalfactoria chinensis TaxID=46218 RepID=UPI003B3AC21E
MGKSRVRKAAKAADVFAIARGAAAGKARAKGRARPVTSGLKKINIVNADKVSKINKAFAEIQKEVLQLSKGTAEEPPKNPKQVTAPPEEEPANVDAAASLLSQL